MTCHHGRRWQLVAMSLLGIALSLLYGRVFALADPDTIRLESITRYDDVAMSGDMFVLVEYTLEYAVLPAENVSQGYLGRLIDVGGSGQLASVQPFAGASIPDQGYSRGAYGFYFSAEPTITGTLRVTLEGNPSLSPTPAGIFSESVTQRDASDLAGDLRAQAVRFEDVWDVDLVSPVSGGVNRYTADGEEYFSSALPNLRNLAPDLFVLQSTQPEVPDRASDTTHPDARRSLLDGTTLETGFIALGDFFGVSATVARFLIALLGAGVAGYFMGKLVPHEEMQPTLQIWAGYVVFLGGYWLGLVTVETIGVMLAVCVVLNVFVLFLQRVTQ